MKILPAHRCMRLAIAGLAFLNSVHAQTQVPPSVSYDSFNDVLQLDWQSTRNRTFFPQVTTDLGTWDYIGALHFGPGSHTGMVQTNAAKAFFRLQYSDLPVATEAEAETADFDVDGLQNLAELQEAHTDPLNSDTDGDTLPDGWELAHSISPLDDGSIDPQNGPDGVFLGTVSGGGSGTFTPFAITTNRNALDAGVQAHPAATLSDKDGDAIPDGLDAGPLSRSIDWESDGMLPRFVHVSLEGYNDMDHGPVIGCNDHGDVVAQKAFYSGGFWYPLAQIPTGSSELRNFKFRVDGREHRAYLPFQPLPDSVSDDGRIVGHAIVNIESKTEMVEGVQRTFSPSATVLAFIWDSWAVPPRAFAHPAGSVLEGNFWNETAQIAADGTVIVRRSANTVSSSNSRYRFIRYDASGGITTSEPYSNLRFPAVGRRGFLPFDTGVSNAFAWLPEEATPRSLLADSTFTTPNPRSNFLFQSEPRYVGNKPGPPGGYCLNFWDKTMIRHEGRWQEARELAGSMHITPRGTAFKYRASGGLDVWRGGRQQSLVSSVANKDFTSTYVELRGSTPDGRTLVYHFKGSEPSSSGYLVPTQLVSRDKFLAGSFEIPIGWDDLEMEFAASSGENLGKYGSLLGGGGTKIYNSVTDILSDADISAGGQPTGQKVWFVRDPANSRKINYYTCFNSAGLVEIKLYLNGSMTPVAAIPHTLVAAQDFADTIGYVDAWVKGTSFNWGGGGDPPLSIQSPPGGPQTFNGSGDGIDNLTRACLIPFFNVINQVEGLSAIAKGLLDGAQGGVEDDWEFLQLIQQNVVLAGNWAYQQAFQELQKWKNDPLKRAAELKQMADRICEDMVFDPLRELGNDLSTWEGFKNRAWRAWEESKEAAQQAWAVTKDVWGTVVDGLIEWADDFCHRMMVESEKVHWESAPWAKDKLLADINSTTRLMSYTFGYTFGYLAEQTAVGILTGGTAKIAQVAKKGGMVLAGTLARRTAAVLAARAHFLKRLLAEVAQLPADLVASYQRGFTLASTGPTGVGMPRVPLEVMQEAVEAGKMVWRDYLDDIFSPNIRQFVRQGGETIIEQRFAQLITILGPDFDGTIGRNFLKVADELILVRQADGTVDDFFESFFRAFRGNPSLMTSADDATIAISSLSPEGKATLKKFLSDPNAGKLWEIDVPAIVDDEPAIPHNYWIRGILGELSIYKKQYKNLGYTHAPTAQGFDFTGPKWVQIKTLKNPDGAIGAMKKAVNDLITFSPGPPNPKPLKLHILKKPGTSSNQLEDALRAHIESSSAADRFELVIQEFEL